MFCLNLLKNTAIRIKQSNPKKQINLLSFNSHALTSTCFFSSRSSRSAYFKPSSTTVPPPNSDGLKLSHFKEEITSIIWQNPRLISDFLQQNLRQLSPGDIATIFFTCAKKKYKLESNDIYTMAKCLESKSTLIRPLTLANILNGLRLHSCKDPSVKYLLNVLKVKLDSLQFDMPPQFVALSLTGLKQMTNSPDTLTLIESLTTKIHQSPNYTIPPSEFGNTLIGLHNFYSEDSRILSLLESLQYILEQYSSHSLSQSTQMTSRSMATSLYGLKGMSWNHQIVRNFYQILLPHFIHCKQPFDRIELGTAFYGLQKFDSSYSLCCDILTVLNEKLLQFKGDLDGQTIGSIFYGLQNLSSDSSVVKSMIVSLTQLLKQFPTSTELSSHSFSSAMYGLRSMSNNVSEVSELIDVFAKLSEQCVDRNERQASIVLLGMRRMNSKQYSVQKILHFVYNILISSSPLSSLPGKFSTYEEYLQYCQQEAGEAKGEEGARQGEGEGQADKVIPTSRVLFNSSFSKPFQLTSTILCKCIHSFQFMSSDEIIVVHLLTYLVHRLKHSSDILQSKDIGLCLYGLQRMNPHNQYVKQVLLDLSDVIEDEKRFAEKYLYSYDVQSVEVGLNGMMKEGTTSELKRLKEVFEKRRNIYSKKGKDKNISSLIK